VQPLLAAAPAEKVLLAGRRNHAGKKPPFRLCPQKGTCVFGHQTDKPATSCHWLRLLPATSECLELPRVLPNAYSDPRAQRSSSIVPALMTVRLPAVNRNVQKSGRSQDARPPGEMRSAECGVRNGKWRMQNGLAQPLPWLAYPQGGNRKASDRRSQKQQLTQRRHEAKAQSAERLGEGGRLECPHRSGERANK
jgi:hypothetical protein